MALHFGADAVYLAGAQFGMRAGAENFTPDGIRAAVQLAHVQGAAVHVTCNTLPRDDEMAQLPAYLELLDDAGVDAIIAADLGVITLAKRYAPHVALHVSTQFGVVNSAAAAALHDLGAQRVVLARELSLAEIAAIRAHTPPELELEAFVHGAMCVSFSGRCLLSNYLTGRDANRGRCAQPCRWKYGLTESKRPGQVFDITEDARGTYIFNSRDMCMIDHLPELLAAGITSLKIEGRTKSAPRSSCRRGHECLPPRARRCRRRAAARPGLAARGAADQPPAVQHRVLLWSAGAVHGKLRLLCRGGGLRRCGGRCARRARRADAAQQVFRRRHARARHERRAARDLHGAGSARCRWPSARERAAPDAALYHAAAVQGRAAVARAAEITRRNG